MAGFGARSYGRGKRPQPSASSSSSYFSIITLVIFLAFCLLGVWMLTTSSVVPVQVTTTAHRTFRGLVSSSFPSRKGSGDPDEDPQPRHLRHNGIVKDVRAGNGEEDDDATTLVGGNEDKQVAEDGTNVIRLPGEDNGTGEKDIGGKPEGSGEDGGGNEGGSEEGHLPSEEGGEQKIESRLEGAEVGGGAKEKEQEQVGPEEESQSQEQERLEEQRIQKRDEEGDSQQQTEQTVEKIQADEGLQDQQDKDSDNQGTKEENEGGEESSQNSETVAEDLKGSEVEGEGEGNLGTKKEQVENERSEKLEESEKQDLGADAQEKSGVLAGETATDTTGGTVTDTESRDTQEESSQQHTQGDGGDSEEGNNQEQQDRNTEEEQQTLAESQDKENQLENLRGDSVGERKADLTEGEELRKESSQTEDGNATVELGSTVSRNWVLCNVTAGSDYIPCLDNEEALKYVHITGHFEHRERHCPEERPTCLVPLPKGYQRPIVWPRSRDKIWYNNVPHKKLADVKGHQNWMKVTGEHIIFPGGGTQFIHGALHYIDFIQKAVPRIGWGKHTRVILDVGCGVASFGGYLFERDVIAMSFAPKDEHEAQTQFALERGIPAISAVMGTQRLPFPSAVFDIVHCARCRVPWPAEGGRLLLELNRVLRPGGYFVWSATPVYQKLKEDVEIWNAMTAVTKSMCWDLVTIKKDRINSVGAAVYRKPVSNECYDNRKSQSPPMCKDDDDANAAWYVPLQSCMHRVPIHSSDRGSQWPVDWPRRLHAPPYWLNKIQKGIYGKPEPDDFKADSEYWKHVVEKSYLNTMGISWSKVRNVMDMRAVYGGFAAALKDMKVWVMNVVNIDSVDTLPIIYERGLFGIYHDWCESFSTYPRTYDLLHADHLFSKLKKRCYLLPVMVEVDRVLRPGGTLIVRDESAIVSEVESLLKSLHWEVRLTFSKSQKGILCAEKSDWRPETFSTALQ